MLIVTALAALIGVMTSGLRMAAGVLLGSALCVFNLRWLRASTGAMLAPAVTTQDNRIPKWTASKFVIRWIVLVVIAWLAVLTGWFELLGIGIGLGSFVGAVMLESTYQAFLTFKQ